MNKYIISLCLFVLIAGCVESTATNTPPIIKSLNKHGDCDNSPPGEANQMCLLQYNIEGYGLCSFMVSDGYYSGGPTLIGCKT
jgi:hypothetical protein